MMTLKFDSEVTLGSVDGMRDDVSVRPLLVEKSLKDRTEPNHVDGGDVLITRAGSTKVGVCHNS